jgi:NTE family protein
MFKKNKDLSLILSGGSALGFAHFGVLKALEEKQITPTEIIGTSMGAIAGALLASKFSYKEIEEIIDEINYLKLLKINILSLTSLIDQKKIRDFLSTKIGETTFNETKIDLKIITTNINTGHIKIFNKKDTPNIKIIDAICASIAIPAVFKPYQINGETYVDGFLCSNLPFEYASSKKILAINLITQKYVENLNSKYVKEILEKSFYISQLNQTRQKLKTNKNKQLQIVCIDIEGFKPYDFHKSKQIIEKGYEQFNLNYNIE